jgi:hypothetical protein
MFKSYAEVAKMFLPEKNGTRTQHARNDSAYDRT